jgi:probable HAF family extracellular repeat protein
VVKMMLVMIMALAMCLGAQAADLSPIAGPENLALREQGELVPMLSPNEQFETVTGPVMTRGNRRKALYNVVELMAEGWSNVMDINDAGLSVGWTYDAQGNKTGACWLKDGKLKRVEGTAVCSAINNSGQFGGIGFQTLPGYQWPVQRAFLGNISKESIVDLTSTLKGLPLGSAATWVTSITGNAFCGEMNVGGYWKTFVSDRRFNAKLLPLYGVRGMSDNGLVAGNSSNHLTPALWSNMGGVQPLPMPLVTFAKAEAKDVNNCGQTVGNYQTAYSFERTSHALYWYLDEDGVRQVDEMGTLPGYTNSRVNCINNRGQAVGTAISYDSATHNLYLRPFLWENGKMIDLAKVTDLGTWVLDGKTLPIWRLDGEAVAVNSAGDIACNAWNTQLRQEHGVILKRRR